MALEWLKSPGFSPSNFTSLLDQPRTRMAIWIGKLTHRPIGTLYHLNIHIATDAYNITFFW